jgi:hypothetical protein
MHTETLYFLFKIVKTLKSSQLKQKERLLTVEFLRIKFNLRLIIWQIKNILNISFTVKTMFPNLEREFFQR